MIQTMSIFMVNNSITVSFIVLMIIVTLVLRNTEKSTYLPNIVVSIGVLGTFTGIILGLWNFNVSNIQGSIPELLGGLKTAFFTSIAGMIFSINMKMFPRIINSKNVGENNSDVTIETLASLIAEGNKNLEKLNENNSSLLNKMINALTGDGETTLLTQIQKLRTSTSDKLDELLFSLKGFAEKVSKIGSEALIEALSEVIKDFNAKINEQFGENFKHLNEGVEKMLLWQEQYTEQVEKMIDQFYMAADGIESSKKSLEKITEDSSTILEMNQELHPVLIEINNQRKELAEQLISFSEISNQAKEAFPTIQKNLDQVTGTVSKTVTDLSIIQKETLVNTENELKEIIAKVGNQTQNNINEYYNDLKNHLTKFDEALGQTLNKSLDSLGRAMATLSSKFVDDYSPLTEKLKDVVRLAEGHNAGHTGN